MTTTIIGLLEMLETPYHSNTRWIVDEKKDPTSLLSNKPLKYIRDEDTTSKWINVYPQHGKDVYVLDIDDMTKTNEEIHDTVRNMFGFLPPYTLSTVKKKPHYYILIENIELYAQQVNVLKSMKADLLKKSISVECRDSIVCFESEDLEYVDWKTIKHYFDIDRMNFNNQPKDKPKKTLVRKPKVNVSERTSEAEELKEELKVEMKDTDVHKLVHLLSQSTLDNRSEWLNVGFAIKSELNDAGLDLFLQWSSGYARFDQQRDTELYLSLNPTSITIGTLKYYAKRDNPEGYKKLFPSSDITWNDLKERNHANYAKLYVENNPKDYIYSSGCWYKYNEFNRIQQLDTKHPPCLKNKIYEFFRNITMDLTKSTPPNDENLNEKFKLSSETIKFAGTDKDTNGMISFMITHYKDDDLYFKLDTNTNLLAFKNRVYDYSKKKFRKIQRDDFIMKNCRYDINETKNEIIRKKIEDELLNIFDNPIKARFWLEHIALSLFTNKYEMFYCHTGKGGNGKGLLFNFLKASVGDYYYQTGTEFLTTRIEDGKANPTLANAKGVRILVCSEPDTEKTKIKVDFVKSITGNDDINCRDLYSSNKYTYKPTFTSFLQCNDFPDLNKIDGGIRRRLQKVDYPNQFVDKPILKNEKQKDENLKALFSQPDYINEFVLLLIDTAEKTDKLVIPKEIQQSSKAFLDEQDKVYSWLEEFTAKDATGKILKSEAYNLFLSQMNEKRSEFSAIKFHKQMNKNNIAEKKDVNRYYIGIKIIKVIEEQEQKCEIEL